MRYFDKETAKHLVFLTNNLEIPALTVAKLYKNRWQIELFFKWIKGHLRIKHYFGTSPDAVKTQIWIAVAVYLMVAILHKQLQLPGRLHRTWLARPLLRIRYGQLLSIHPFKKVPIHELRTEYDFKAYITHKSKQLMLWYL